MEGNKHVEKIIGVLRSRGIPVPSGGEYNRLYEGIWNVVNEIERPIQFDAGDFECAPTTPFELAVHVNRLLEKR